MSGKAAGDGNRGLVDEGLVSVPDAGRFLGVSRSKVYGLMEQGDLPFCKIGTARRIPRKALVALAERSLVAG